jgi:dihydropyrimidinase
MVFQSYALYPHMTVRRNIEFPLRTRKISSEERSKLVLEAARILGLYPRKGALIPGADADVVIWDPEKRVKYGVEHSHQRTDYNLYEGWELVGYPETVFLRGKLIVDGNVWKGAAGQGQFLKRGAGMVI